MKPLFLVRTSARRAAAAATVCLALATTLNCSSKPQARTFATPEEAVTALTKATAAGDLKELVAIFGPESQSLIDSSDPATARRNQQTFAAAVAERWHLEDQGADHRVLVIGNEDWPFPVPLVQEGTRWRFDTAAGSEEVLARRIGRNELAAIRICRAYVVAQRLYAQRGHDGQPDGVYAQAFRSAANRQDGLYWPAAPGQKSSPLGDLVAYAAQEGQPLEGNRTAPSPFHGYYFRILKEQGPDVPGGAKDYVAGGHMSGGFALVAWPAQYDASGVMTFLVNQDGTIYQKNLGAETDTAVRAMKAYNPDALWGAAE